MFCWALDRVVHVVYVIVSFLAKGGVGKKEWRQYDNKNKIDLGIVLMNYGISTKWKDITQTRPNLIRQTAFVPCDCDKCFFCLNKFTNGITHRRKKEEKVTVMYVCGTRVRTDKCTSNRVNLGLVAARYCRMCYRTQLNTELSSKERKKTCRTSKMECPICMEPICKECWKEGYD